MPKLYPVSVSVMQEGTPLADANVSLRYPDSSIGTWAIGGRTDANGNAKLFTNGYPGAPLGTFKVVLIKHESEGLAEREAALNQGGPSAAQRIIPKVWSCVEAKYNDSEKTPLEVEITTSTKTLSIDAGPVVKIEQKLAL